MAARSTSVKASRIGLPASAESILPTSSRRRVKMTDAWARIAARSKAASAPITGAALTAPCVARSTSASLASQVAATTESSYGLVTTSFWADCSHWPAR